ncbi:hsp90 co-chaperone Cdc37 [Malassezia caprae]|uniref:Hsp90 chaperone protein kinase-targeting subunit n=1 Tax=Malassezia caprae TaxID=1381934 RepID=A0AAF0IWM0_9BASI|nr:hsp90 co-chaperone Cdc37 [Malassezia caprae]
MVGKLNYSKWDNLELSDDSDIEVHPNVDKSSFIRWKQRDIHEKREMRKIRRSQLEAEHRTNEAVSPLLAALSEQTDQEGSGTYSREVSRLAAGRQARGNKDGPEGPTLEDILLSLLLQINEEPDVKKAYGTSRLDAALTTSMNTHLDKIAKRQSEITRELTEMDEEDAHKITSDNLRDGWNSGYVSKEAPVTAAPKKATKTSQHIETLNPGVATGSAAPADTEDSDDEELPNITPTMKSFASLPSSIASLPLSTESLPADFLASKQLNVSAFEKMFQYIGSHKELLRPEYGTTDALLLQAFESQMAGQKALARMCTEKALLIQYCLKLGRDGVSLFFQRMMNTDGKAAVVFLNDVLSTYTRIAQRAKVLREQQQENGEGIEQIQLMAQDPGTVISFEIPDGPPPEEIRLEGEGVEHLDPNQVREWLQRRWDIYMSFDEDFREALASKNLDKVNEVLGRMPVSKAEVIVQDLDRAGILNFSSTEVRDETHA